MKKLFALLVLLAISGCSRFQYNVDGARMKGTIVGSPVEFIQSTAEAEVTRAEAYKRRQCAEDARCLREVFVEQERERTNEAPEMFDTPAGYVWVPFKQNHTRSTHREGR